MARANAAGFRLERRLANFVDREVVLRCDEHALLLLSGGADSMALLALLPNVDTRLGLRLRLSALHVDYGARGAASDRDCEIVVRACEAAGVPLHVVSLRPRLSGAGFQARARAFRYERAAELAAALGCHVVATGHNRDDQAETILYRLAKYATPRGLAGMRPREARLVRPLLCLGAAEIREYCHACGVEYGEDVTNAQPVYARNALRLEVLPALARLNPRVAETLADTAAMAAAEADVLAAATAAAAARSAGSLAPQDLAALDIAALRAEAPALRALVLHEAARKALGGEALVERRVVEALLALCARRDDSGRSSIGRGLEAVRAGGVLHFRRREAPHDCVPASVDGAALAAAEGGGVALAICGRRFRARLLEGSALERDPARACVGLAAPPRRVTLRHLRRGERFAPLGLGHETTVARFLAGARAPASERARALVLTIDDAVAWVGYTDAGATTRGRVAQGFRVRESSRCTLLVVEEDT
ncbi:MAG: tRNA lysidine(34) synthetase TilS [Actinobacteria bacterium]|nr:tRNA lysidine(34) synthetase TilS [Actinomycetota bacterium]